MHVKAILEGKGRTVVTAEPQETIAAVAQRLAQHRIGAVIVVEAGHVAGILSERDIVGGLAHHGPGVSALTAGELMSHPVHTCRPQDTIDQIMQVMTERRVRHLPVVDEGELIGIISIGDVVKHKLDLSEMEVTTLRQYVLEGR